MEGQTLNINIAGRNYDIDVESDERDIIEKVVLQINNKISNLKNEYGISDSQDLLAMSTLELLTIANRKENHSEKLSPEVVQKLNSINQLLVDNI